MRTLVIDRRSRAVALGMAMVALLTLSGCGTAEIAAAKSHGTGTASAAPTPTSQRSAAATLADLLVTYKPGTPCADVLIDTPVEKVSPACAALWAPLRLTVIPGQSLLQRAPRFPSLGAGPGVTPDEALRSAAGFWRTEAFQGFALGTRQLTVVEPLGKDGLFMRVGAMERAVWEGDTVSTPLCHFFPVAIGVVQLAPDFAQFEQRTGRALGVHARYHGPCHATATNAQGAQRELLNFTGDYDVVFVGDLHDSDPLGPILWITGLAECSKEIAKKTCAE